MNPSKPLYYRRRFPAEIINQCVWLYFRFCLSYRDIEEIMARRLRSRATQPGDRWHLDDTCQSTANYNTCGVLLIRTAKYSISWCSRIAINRPPRDCPGFRFEWLLLAQTVKNVVGIFIGNLQEKSTAQNDLQATISYQERVSFPVSYIG